MGNVSSNLAHSAADSSHSRSGSIIRSHQQAGHPLAAAAIIL